MSSWLLLVAIILHAALPYLPPAVAGWKYGAFGRTVADNRPVRFWLFWLLEVLILLVVGPSLLICSVALQFIEVDNEPLARSIARAPQFLQNIWQVLPLMLAPPGILIGGILLNRAVLVRKLNNNRGNLLLSFGAFCLLYGLATPGIISWLIASMRDAYLFKG
jgi:hypothetical protein